MTRNELLLSTFDPSGIGLEIGAGFNPLLPKAAGYRVETLDHATADQLRDKYRNDPNVDIARIEEVDFVADGTPIAEVVGKPGHYDYIVASHIIEHTPDMLGFLKDCETLLKQGGILVLAVPDKRRCFDLLQPLTSTGMILQAHAERRVRRKGSPLPRSRKLGYYDRLRSPLREKRISMRSWNRLAGRIFPLGLVLVAKVRVCVSRFFVMPAKAGIQGQHRGMCPWTPRFRGGDDTGSAIGFTIR